MALVLPVQSEPGSSAQSSVAWQSCWLPHIGRTGSVSGQNLVPLKWEEDFVTYMHTCSALDSSSVKLGIMKHTCLCKSLQIHKWKGLPNGSVKVFFFNFYSLLSFFSLLYNMCAETEVVNLNLTRKKTQGRKTSEGEAKSHWALNKIWAEFVLFIQFCILPTAEHMKVEYSLCFGTGRK